MRAIYVSMPSCGPCKAFLPIFRKLTAVNDIPVEYLCAEEDSRKVGPLMISCAPTVIFYEGANEVGRWAGAFSEKAVEKMLKELKEEIVGSIMF